jgi:hypothetical protein
MKTKQLFVLIVTFSIQFIYADTLDCSFLQHEISQTRKQFVISSYLLIPCSFMGMFLMQPMRKPNAPPISKSTERIYQTIGITGFICFYIDIGYMVNRGIKISHLEKQYKINCMKTDISEYY